MNIDDIVSVMNFRIIICGTYIIMNKPKGMMEYDSQTLRKRVTLNVACAEIEEKEEDTELKVYNKSEYFFRMPRFRTSVEEEEIYIDPPPEQEKQDDMPLAYTLGPMITMGITSMVSGVTAVSNVMGGTQSLSSALPSLVTCGAMLLSMLFWPLLQKRYTAKQKKKREQHRIKKYNEYIEERRQHIKNVVSKQRQSLIENNIPLDECKQIIVNRKRNLWERKIILI